MHPVRNPRTGQEDYRITYPTANEITELCALLRSQQLSWKRKGIAYRVQVLQSWKSALIKRREPLINALMEDTGRKWETIRETSELEKCIDFWCNYGEAFFEHKLKSYSPKDEHQLVGVLSPNVYPLLTSIADAIPALVAGFGVVIKPGPLTPRFIAHLNAAINDVEDLKSIIQFIPGDEKIGNLLIHQVDIVCFTGRQQNAESILRTLRDQQKQCFFNITKSTTALVLADANIDRAAQSIIKSITVAAGTSCKASRIVYADQKIITELTARLSDEIDEIELAFPTVEDGNLGPVLTAQSVIETDTALDNLTHKSGLSFYGNASVITLGQSYWYKPVLFVSKSLFGNYIDLPSGPYLLVIPFIESENIIYDGEVVVYSTRSAADLRKWAQQNYIKQLHINQVVLLHFLYKNADAIWQQFFPIEV